MDKIIYYYNNEKHTDVNIKNINEKKLHRVDKPALITPMGSYWYRFGKLHRLGGPAAVWSFKESNGYCWYVNGKKHRLDGPAIVWQDDKEWWVNDKRLDTNEVETWIKNNNINLKTKQHQALFMMKFG